MHEYEAMNNEIQIKIGDISISKSKGLMRNTELTELNRKNPNSILCFRSKGQENKLQNSTYLVTGSKKLLWCTILY